MSEDNVNNTIEQLLNRDAIYEMIDKLLKKYPTARYCLVSIIDDEHGCTTNQAGLISGLEYIGLGVHLNEYCRNSADEMMDEDNIEP